MPLPENRLSFEQQRINADLHSRRISGELEGKAKEFAERIHKIFNQNRQGLQSAASSSYSTTDDSDNNNSSTEINQQINIVSSPTDDSNIQQSPQQLRVEPLTDTSSSSSSSLPLTEQNNGIGKISPIIQSSIASLGSLGSNIISENLESIKETSESSNKTLSNLLSFFQTKEEKRDRIQNLKKQTEKESTSSLVSQRTTVINDDDEPSKPRPESKKDDDDDDDDDKKSKFRTTIEGAGKAGFATLPPIVQVGLSSLGSGLMGLSGRFRRNRRTQNADDGDGNNSVVVSSLLPQDTDSLPKDQKEYYENSQPIFEEIKDNTEESKNSLINLMNFLKGNDEVINNNEYEKKDHIESLKEETEKEKESLLKIQSGNEEEKSDIVPPKEEKEKETEKTKKKKDESKFRTTIEGAGKAGFATLPPIVQVGLSSLLIDPAMSLLGKKDKEEKEDKKKAKEKRKKTSEKSDVIKNDSKAISSRSEDLEITQQQEQSDSIVNDSRVKRQLSEEHRRKISEGLKQSRLRRETAPSSPTVVIVQQQENQNDTNVSKEIHSTQRDYIDNQKSQIEIQSDNREVQKEFHDSQNNFIESQKDFQSDQKEYYESSQIELQEIQNNTESTKSTLISLMDFFKGNELKEYEEKREEEIRNDRLISAIEDLSTIKSTGQQPEKKDDKKGIFALGTLLGLKLKALGAVFLAFLPIIAKVALVGAALYGIFKLFGSDAMKDVVEKVKSVWNEQILPAFVGLKDALVDLWEKGLKTFVVDTIGVIADTISGIVKGVTQIFEGDLKGGIITIFQTLVTGIKNQLDNVFTLIARIFGLDFFEGDGSVFKFAERKIGEAQQWIIDKFDGMIEGIKKLFDRITGAIKNIPLPAWAKRRLGIEEDEQTEEERLISEREELQRRIQNIEQSAQQSPAYQNNWFGQNDGSNQIGASDRARIEQYQNEISEINEQLEAGPRTVIPEPDSIEELPIRPEQSAAFTAQAIERAREDFPEVPQRTPEELEQQREEIRQRNEELVQRIEIDSQLRNQRIESAQQTVDAFTIQIEEKNEEIDRLLSIAETRALTRQELGLKANLENQVQTYQNIIDQQKAEIERLSVIEEETIGVVNDDTSETADRRDTLDVPSDATSIAPAAEQQPSTRGSLTLEEFQDRRDRDFLFSDRTILNFYRQNPDILLQKANELPNIDTIGAKVEKYISDEYRDTIDKNLRSSGARRRFFLNLRNIAEEEQARQRSSETVPDNDIEGVIPPSRIDISVPASDSLYEADTTRLETPFRMDAVEPIPIEPVPVSEPLMMQQGQRTQLQEQVEIREAENAREGGIGGIQQVNNYNSSNSTTQVIRPSPSPTSRIESAQDIYSMPQMVPF